MKRLYPLTLFMALAVVLNCASTDDSVRMIGGYPKINTSSHFAQIESIDKELKISNASDETKSKLYLTKGRLLLELGKYDDSIETLNQIFSLKNANANSPELNLYLGRAHIGKNQYAKAIQYLNQSEKLDKTYNPERKKLVVQSLVAEREYYPALAALTKTYHKGNQKKDEFYYETAAKTYLKMGYDYKNAGFYQKGLQVANLGLEEFPENETLRSIQKECMEVLQPEGKL
ncbi:tetratricopeptide repeat protein [Leptospira ilyithenensis]|uniref:Tetratricopeptide repeat protein n=1 Tax=Leptospira ilyithenensis TaxID=2484901 RepID=A0A4R9LK34_9LEPT|nr:tetratricopeptide repeat protein [Leptospira ilyithenensis]TGN07925.1 tetratricopeptide repeat protein [Leptospira ilyithenensis]